MRGDAAMPPDPAPSPAAEVHRLIADAQAADTAYRLAAVKVAVYEFLHQHGRSESPVFKVALDLAVSLRKIIDGDEGGAPGA